MSSGKILNTTVFDSLMDNKRVSNEEPTREYQVRSSYWLIIYKLIDMSFLNALKIGHSYGNLHT